MTIYASENLNQAIFDRLRAIGLRWNVQVVRKPIAEPLQLPIQTKNDLNALQHYDALLSIYKGMCKLENLKSDKLSIAT